MKISSIAIKNFKGLEDITLNLNGKCTIIFGINGVGKSSVLRSIDLLYANIIGKLIKSAKPLAQLNKDDIMFGKAKTEIKASFVFDDDLEATYGRSLSRINKSPRKHSLKDLTELTNLFEERYITKSYEDKNGNLVVPEDTKNMPVFVNYGVNRLVIDVPVRTTNNNKYTKLGAFDKAIESKIDFRTLFTWFRYQEDLENQEKVRSNISYEDKELKAVKTAMLAMLDGFDNIQIDRKPLSMKVNKNGKSLKINQLSDGEKCTIALFGDLARRMALANPSLDNPLDGSGVVLIDELELHMHTSWQRQVLPKLHKIFPNIQFIITTHSPQILGEVDKNFNIFTLERINDKIEINKYNSFWGWDSNVILEDVMKTSSVNESVKEKVNEMYNELDKRNFTKAEAIADYIDDITDRHNEDTAKARVLIARGKRNEKNK